MDAKKDKNELGERLKLARTINDLKLEEVTNQLEITKGTLSRYESGDRKPGNDMLNKLASIYKVSTDFLNNGTFQVSNPGQLLLDFNTAGYVEVPKEKHEISRKLLSEKVKKVLSEKIEKLNSEDLLQLLDLDEEHLRAISYIFKNSSLMSSIKKMNYSHIPNLNKIEEFINELD